MHKAKVLPGTFYIMPILEEIPKNCFCILSSGLEVKANLDFQDAIDLLAILKTNVDRTIFHYNL